MKALSVRQPWADLIASGKKTLEIRSWKTDYRGPLLICASAKRLPKFVPYHDQVRYGVAVCVVHLNHCRLMAKGDEKWALCDWIPDYYAWEIANVRRVKDVPIKGMLKLFDVPDDFIKLR